ncbi:restriction endonuclease subunit [Sesbania bispinosa]|nr:restriction endonuclease subunit [Sesbania bispinosa]
MNGNPADQANRVPNSSGANQREQLHGDWLTVTRKKRPPIASRKQALNANGQKKNNHSSNKFSMLNSLNVEDVIGNPQYSTEQPRGSKENNSIKSISKEPSEVANLGAPDPEKILNDELQLDKSGNLPNHSQGYIMANKEPPDPNNVSDEDTEMDNSSDEDADEEFVVDSMPEHD